AKHGRSIVDLEIGCQAIDLKAAAVGKDRPVPVHEPVQAAQIGNHLIARTQGEVIRVAEDYLRPDALQFIRRESLDCRLRADGHEGGRFDDAMGRVNSAAPGERSPLAPRGIPALAERGPYFVGAKKFEAEAHLPTRCPCLYQSSRSASVGVGDGMPFSGTSRPAVQATALSSKVRKLSFLRFL